MIASQNDKNFVFDINMACREMKYEYARCTVYKNIINLEYSK